MRVRKDICLIFKRYLFLFLRSFFELHLKWIWHVLKEEKTDTLFFITKKTDTLNKKECYFLPE